MGVTVWGMLGNDTLSDCGPAAIEHSRIAKAAQGAAADGTPILPSTFAAPTEAHTASWYFGYGISQGEPAPAPDQGVDNKSMLMYLYNITAGVIPTPAGDDITEWAFAELDVTNPNEVHQALLDFHGVLMGCSLTDQAETEFSDHQPWTVTASEQPDPNNGHDTWLVAYDAEGETTVTWGALQRITVDWESAETAGGDLDMWVIVTAEDAARVGMTAETFAALQAEIRALGGTVDPVAPPEPSPAPVPAPEPAPPPAPEPAPEPAEGKKKLFG